MEHRKHKEVRKALSLLKQLEELSLEEQWDLGLIAFSSPKKEQEERGWSAWDSLDKGAQS